ncbi:MAG: ribonuclease D [Acidobacteria bacterium]|nr:ribonuclease D [Acidobacteriota bacterium]NIM60980.1 ribonuclease D [Acidobacteriota bacterium]NIO59948.1 ribonuclease D [Acidobacteriota bacterium]NIQ31020.1 ribonuclease D [Acidobacteriota bacterium]NIQ86148.1 ribonuclease D [Acidobacteriota bacterium]
MDRQASWIDRTEDLEEALSGLGNGPLAIDTEADSLHHYPEKVCLIQLSFGDRDYLVDPLAEISLDPLAERLADRSILKILHGADYDLRMLHRGFGMTFAGLFDTMIAARIVGETRFGLAALLEQHFGVPLDKKFQRADWSKRPLTPEMARYAAMDTHYLIALQSTLASRLEALGRSGWAAEEFERLEGIRSAPRTDSDQGFRRVKGSGRLERKKMAVLRELWALRETYALHLDRPPFRVLNDERLLELTENPPRRMTELETMKRLPRPWRHGRRARELLDAIRTGLDMPSERWPRRSKGGRGRSSTKVCDERLAAIREHRDRIAGELGLEPSLVGPRAVLEEIVDRMVSGEDPAATPDLRRWQWKLLAPAAETRPG